MPLQIGQTISSIAQWIEQPPSKRLMPVQIRLETFTYFTLKLCICKSGGVKAAHWAHAPKV